MKSSFSFALVSALVLLLTGGLVHCVGNEPAIPSGDGGDDNTTMGDAPAQGEAMPDQRGDGPDAGEAGETGETGAVDGCASGAPCDPATCATGVTVCTDAGKTACSPTGTTPDGTTCDAGVCNNGACNPCTAGGDCTPGSPPNACQTGKYSCSTGQQACNATGNVTDTTPCGGGSSICCGGNCASCSTTTNATDTCSGTTCKVNCSSGFALCGGECVDTTSNPQACGASCRVCPTGAGCVNSFCTIEYGYSTQFTCNSASGIDVFPAGEVIGEGILIQSTITVTALGLISRNGGGSGSLALYTDAGGRPGTLKAQTGSMSIPANANVPIPVSATVSVPAGTYWIMSEFASNSSICVDSAAGNTLYYEVTGSFPSTFPTTSPPAESIPNTVHINFYVVGQD